MGEFGGDMAMIFAADASPDVSWDDWEYFRGPRKAVFSYSVGLPKSRFTLFYLMTAVDSTISYRHE